ncbi:UbiA family prenyltransferase [Cellulomonas sp. ES6]|uniref:UbiA family prenyltransferase n=1 Tax=Cellulomonas sp. ES6 TaxID=3039384 RepID=UPI0024B6C611|nr:UbiA family prenyltransferase [Cellulomonas sp. ES6]WHP17932.1 UbiA family prenyltransferase [Cellulomonas sp. ES6]
MRQHDVPPRAGRADGRPPEPVPPSSTPSVPPSAAPSATRRATALLRACHPAPAAAVTLFAGAFAAGAADAGPGRALLVAAAVLAGQLSVGWSNDWIDAARDRAVGRVGKPVVSGDVSPAGLRTAALAAAAACVLLSAALGAVPGALHVGLVAVAWGYNAGLKSTAWSWVPYAVAFGGLPSVATLAVADPAPAPWWVTAGAAGLGVGAHLANVLPDLEDDAATGVHGLPHRLGRRRTATGAAAVLLAAAAVVVLASPGAPGAGGLLALAATAALATSAAVVALRSPASRWPFRAAMLTAAVVVVLLVATG